jgi:hypothetical protein
MRFLVLKAYLTLIYFDLFLARGNFTALHHKVRNHPLRNQKLAPDAVARICAAIDNACIWYWKQPRCLQRSAATAYLLKRTGIPAVMVIGIQRLPFKAHAWVEVEGAVVNDKPYVTQIYAVVDRC